MILDTSFILDVWEGDDDAEEKLRSLKRANIEQNLSSMTVFELYHGVEVSNKPKREQQKVLRALSNRPVFDASRQIMSKAGRIYGDLEKKGEQIGEPDCIIAATAIINSEPVLTRNTDHFRRVSGIAVETY